MKASVGVIGLGALGRPIAERVLAAGHSTAVYDVRGEPLAALAARGAIACGSPAEVAARSELTLSLVADESQTEDVVFGPHGLLEAMRPGAVLVVGSTLSPAAVRKIADAVLARGGEALDAPISGGLVAAREGTLSMMIGGSEATLERALPVLSAFARTVIRAGEVGAGQTAKLAHQLVFSLNVMALLEGLALGAAGGVEPRVLKEIFRAGIADSAVLGLWSDLGPRWKNMLKATAPGTALPNLRKDLHLVLEYAKELGVDLPLGVEGSRIADAGSAAGHRDPAL
jgi:2-hydroxy-3-oxopropionate reductase